MAPPLARIGTPPDRPETTRERKARHRAAAAERKKRGRQVVELVLAGGLTIRQAADVIGIPKSTATQAYRRELDSYLQDAERQDEQFKERQLARLERMLRGLWPKASSGDNAAVRSALRVTDQMNRLKGAYPPVAVDLDVAGSLRVDRVIPPAELSEKLAEIRRSRAGETIDVASTVVENGVAAPETNGHSAA